MMQSTQALRTALDEVPRTLLVTETARVLNGSVSSLEIIERSAAKRPVVVLVGPTGAGKSYVFNAILGEDASPEGVLRPTTSSIVIAGDPASIEELHVPDAVIIPKPDLGLTLIDMPEMDGRLPDLDALDAEPDLVVMVISPIRYGDAAVVDVWRSLDPASRAVVLNRVNTNEEETPGLIAAVTDMFGTEPYVIQEGSADATSVADHISTLVSDSRPDALTSIMVRTAVAGTRFVAREVTAAALDIGAVTGAIDDIPDCGVDVSAFDVQVTWDGTRDGIIERAAINVRDRDDDIMRGSETELAERILEGLKPWEGDDLVSSLDLWRERCISTFLDAASIRWRRSNAEQLIQRFSWSTAINPGITTPKRFARIMGDRYDEATSGMQTALEQLVCETLDLRVAAWQDELDRLGDYQPGVLASSADAVESQWPVRD